MKSWKKFLIVSLSLLFVVTSVFAGLSNFGNYSDRTKGNNNSNQESSVVTPTTPKDYESMGIHFASAGEETGAESAPSSMKGGAIIVGAGAKAVINSSEVSYHEATYGGAFYVEAGGVLEINPGAVLKYNGAEYGGAIYIEYGGKCIINGGEIINNNAEHGYAIWCAPDPNYTGDDPDLAQNFAALELGTNSETGETIKLETVVSNNEYAKYGDFNIDYYINGQLMGLTNQKIDVFKANEAPIDYSKCVGWFLDKELTLSIDEGDILTETGLIDSTGSERLNLYTREVTDEMIEATTFEPTSSYTCKLVSSTAENLVVPKVYNGMVVSGIVEGSFTENTTIKNIVLPSGIINIPNNAFLSSTLESINITDNVLEIGESAFKETPLTYVYINEKANLYELKDEVFASCENLKEILIPNSLRVIGWRAFYNTTTLEKVHIFDINRYATIDFYQGNSCPLYLGNSALYLNNEKLTEIELSDITKISKCAFTGYKELISIYLPDTLTTIGESAFHNCSGLQTINIHDGITQIDRSAFNSCSSLQSIYIPSNLTILNEYMFYYCTGATSLVFGENCQIKTIANYVFTKCENIDNITIPANVESIGNFAFSGCNKVTDITIPSSVSTFGTESFSGCEAVENFDWELSDTSITNATLKDVFKNLGASANYATININSSNMGASLPEYAFTNCVGIKEINLSYINFGIFAFGKNVFTNCSGVEKINLVLSGTIDYSSNVASPTEAPFVGCGNLANDCVLSINSFSPVLKSWLFIESGITKVVLDGQINQKIPNYTFQNCTRLTDFDIVNGSISEVGIGGFAGCTALETIDLMGIDKSGQNAFEECSSITTINIDSADNWCLVTFEDIEANPLYLGNAELFVDGTNFNDLTIEITNCINKYAFYNYNKLTNFDCFATCGTIFDYAFYSSGLTDVIFDDDAQYEVQIYDYAFGDCESILSIYLSDNCTAIGAYAFDNTPTLRALTINMQTTPTCFKGHTGLRYVYFGDNCTTIASYSFQNCTNLNNTGITECGDYVTSVGAHAFEGCINLGSLPLPSLQSVSDYAFNGCTSLENIMGPMYDLNDILNYNHQIVGVGDYAFQNCSNFKYFSFASNLANGIHIGIGAFKASGLTSITINNINGLDSLAYTIQQSAFQDCKSLQSVTLEGGDYTIDASAFKNCSALTTINLDSVWKFGTESFANCTGLTSLNFTQSDYFSPLAFSGCVNVETITMTGALCYVEDGVNTTNGPFKNVGKNAESCKLTAINVDKYMFGGSGITDLELNITGGGDGVGESAFQSCTKLKSVVVNGNSHDSNYIGRAAFNACTALEEVKLNNVNSISNYGFQNCSSLKSISMYSVWSIGTYAFNKCSALESVNMQFSSDAYKWSIGGGYATVTEDNVIEYLTTKYINNTWVLTIQ